MMEENNVLLRGISYAPDDLQSTDGDMSVCHNFVYEHGSLRPLVFPKSAFRLRSGENLIYIDTIHTNKHYIVLINDKHVGAFRLQDGARKDFDLRFSLKEGEKLNSVQSIGNILMFYTTDGCHYAVWKENNYTYLGNGLPEIPVSFGLRGTVRTGDKFELKFSEISRVAGFTFAEDDQRGLTDTVMAQWNKFLNEEGTEKNKFAQPFFVRCAIRLTDGSIIHHGPPVLMMPTTRYNPLVYSTERFEANTISACQCSQIGVFCDLDYRVILEDAEMKALQVWDGIIQGIEIYASQPIYLFDTSKPIVGFSLYGMSSVYFLGKIAEDSDWVIGNIGANNKEQICKYYQRWSYTDLKLMNDEPQALRAYPSIRFPMFEEGTQREKVGQTSLFYKIASVRLKDLSNKRTKVDISEGLLKNLALQERMTDDYRSHDDVMAEYTYVYNQRMHLTDISTKLFSGFMVDEMVCFTESQRTLLDIDHIAEEAELFIGATEARVELKEGGQNYVTMRKGRGVMSLSNMYYLYYPNPKAYGMTICLEQNNTKRNYLAALTEHSGLNGSYWFNGFDAATIPLRYDLPEIIENIRINLPNKIYVSEVGQPLYFPLSGVQTVGTGRIVGLSSVTKPLSEGQFGQFPLLVFSSDGLWAMEVNPNTGLYTSSYPLSRDVCINPDSLVQTDGAVYFVTDRGVMVADGSKVVCVSEALDGIPFYPYSVHMLPYMLQRENLPELSDPFILKEFLLSCKTSYDYANERLFFYSARYRIGLLYQISTGMWSTFGSDFINGISDYPNSYLIRKDRSVVHLSEKRDFQNGSPVKCLFVTRPLKLGDVGYKTVSRILVRGGMRGKFGMMLFGSHDCEQYAALASVKGTSLSGIEGSPMKYFRVAFAREMTVQEYIASLSVYSQRRWRETPR